MCRNGECANTLANNVSSGTDVNDKNETNSSNRLCSENKYSQNSLKQIDVENFKTYCIHAKKKYRCNMMSKTYNIYRVKVIQNCPLSGMNHSRLRLRYEVSFNTRSRSVHLTNVVSTFCSMSRSSIA